MQIYPVIHYLDAATALGQVVIAKQCGADGVFLISHHGRDDDLISVARESKQRHPDFQIGINLLSNSPRFAAESALEVGLDMVWADDMGVDSRGITTGGDGGGGAWLSDFAHKHPAIKLFASVAFKYRPHEPHPDIAAERALIEGFIPTTSGSGTGSAPDVSKIALMSKAADGQLAIASGMTPENVADYAPYLSHILVATGIAVDDYRMDAGKLTRLISVAKASSFSLKG